MNSRRFPEFVIMLVFIAACQPEQTKPADDIVYVDVTPDIVLQSVRYFTPSQITWMNCPDVPVPVDSTTTCELDMNGDDAADFLIDVSHWFYGSCGHCESYIYQIFIEGVFGRNFVAMNDTLDQVPQMLNAGDTIDADRHWAARADLLFSGGCSSDFLADFEDGYIGVKVGDAYGYIHVAKIPENGIEVTEYGLNISSGRPIVCGQRTSK